MLALHPIALSALKIPFAWEAIVLSSLVIVRHTLLLQLVLQPQLLVPAILVTTVQVYARYVQLAFILWYQQML